jgi:hypothetical protein
MLSLLTASMVAGTALCGTVDRERDVTPRHFVFFRRDHERISGTAGLPDRAQ